MTKSQNLKTLDYLTGVVDAIIEIIRCEYFFLDDEKEFNYTISTYADGWIIKMTWAVSYDKNDKIEYDNQDLFFNFTSSNSKIIKEIRQQIETIHNLDLPQLSEYDNSDFIYENKRDN